MRFIIFLLTCTRKKTKLRKKTSLKKLKVAKLVKGIHCALHTVRVKDLEQREDKEFYLVLQKKSFCNTYLSSLKQ